MGFAFGLLGLAYLTGLISLERTRHLPLPVLGQVADFTLANQDNQVTKRADLSNHVWVADIIFTPLRRAMSHHDRSHETTTSGAAVRE